MADLAPAENDILCEICGYTLNGLPLSGKCPECGSEIDLSVSPLLRAPPVWEDITHYRSSPGRFIRTTVAVIFRTSRFFRSLNARGEAGPARRFAQIHWMIASAMLGMAWWLHWDWYQREIMQMARPAVIRWMLAFLLPMLVYLAISTTEWLAARLTAWEAGYRGYRLPHPVVVRALYYHSANLLPVAIIAPLTIGGYSFLEHRRVFPVTSDTAYLYTLSGEIILLPILMFQKYWTAMRNLMYANR